MVDSGKKSIEKQWKWNGESRPACPARGSQVRGPWIGMRCAMEWRMETKIYGILDNGEAFACPTVRGTCR